MLCRVCLVLLDVISGFLSGFLVCLMLVYIIAIIVYGVVLFVVFFLFFFFFKQKTAYEMRISDWSSDVCSSDLLMSLLTPLGDALRCSAMSVGVMGVSVPGGAASSLALPYWLSASMRIPGAMAQADSRQAKARVATMGRILSRMVKRYAAVVVVIKVLSYSL